MKTPKLKPCPFCGGKAKMQSDIRYPRPKCDANTAFEVVCQNWNCIIGFVDERYYLSEQEAAEAWNRRTNEDTVCGAWQSCWNDLKNRRASDE